MTDLEITRLCGKAMNLDLVQRNAKKSSGYWSMELCKHYDPLHDDAQAMALVRKFRLNIVYIGIRESPSTRAVEWWCMDVTQHFEGPGDTLNQAICECVAKMRQAKIKEVQP